MNTAIWIVQILLALAFGMSGFMKATQPREKLATNMGWVNDFSPNIVKAIGVLEILAAIGLVLPALTSILPILTPIEAVGLILTMLGASLTHFRRGEMPMIAINLVLLALAVLIVYCHLVAVPL